MATVASLVDRALRTAGIPILGVSIGVVSDRGTWAVQFDPSATPAQRTTAASILASVAVDAAAQTAADQQNAQAAVDAYTSADLAMLRVMLDEINVLRTELNTLRAAVSPPLTPALPLRTENQVRNALRNKAGL